MDDWNGIWTIEVNMEIILLHKYWWIKNVILESGL